MRENASEVNEGLNVVIEELQQDLEYNPMTFFGIAMWPDQILSLIYFVLTIILGLAFS